MLEKLLINYLLRHKYKDEGNDAMQLLVKLITNSLYGEQIRKDKEGKFACKSAYSIMLENDKKVVEYWRTSHGNHIVKMEDEKGLENEVKKLNTMPLHLGAFVLSNSKRIMNNFINAI